MSRVIDLHEPGSYPAAVDDMPEELPNPLEELERLASSVVERRTAAVESVLDEGRKRLQQGAERELERLVGRLIIEVGLAETPRGRVGRAIACGAKLLEARPPDHVVAEFADPAGFVAKCRAACTGLVGFIGSALNQSLVTAGAEPIDNVHVWVGDCARTLHLAVAGTAIDGVDRKAQLALLFARTLDLPCEPAANS